MFAVAANCGHNLASIDIKGDFLQGEKLDRIVLIKPPTDICKKKPVIFWSLNKELDGLNDAAPIFYYRVCVILEDNRYNFVVLIKPIFIRL